MSAAGGVAEGPRRVGPGGRRAGRRRRHVRRDQQGAGGAARRRHHLREDHPQGDPRQHHLRGRAGAAPLRSVPGLGAGPEPAAAGLGQRGGLWRGGGR